MRDPYHIEKLVPVDRDAVRHFYASELISQNLEFGFVLQGANEKTKSCRAVSYTRAASLHSMMEPEIFCDPKASPPPPKPGSRK